MIYDIPDRPLSPPDDEPRLERDDPRDEDRMECIELYTIPVSIVNELQESLGRLGRILEELGDEAPVTPLFGDTGFPTVGDGHD